jgi:DNA polymerase I-like protein with 3'-5' exonuclease and polymerase domains
MQVHNELVLEVAEAAVEEVCRQIGPLMAEAAALTVPLRTRNEITFTSYESLV